MGTKRQIISVATTFSCLLLASTLSYASAEGFFFGANVDYASIDPEDITVGNTTFKPDEQDVFGGGLDMGYNFNNNWAFEVGAVYFSDIDYKGTNGPTRKQAIGYLTLKPMVQWPNGFSAFARGGAAYYYAKEEVPNGNDEETNHLDVIVGAGVGYNLNPNLEIDLSINHVTDTDAPITFGMLEISYHAVTKYNKSGFLAD